MPRRGADDGAPRLRVLRWQIDEDVFAQFSESGSPGAWIRSTLVVPIEE